MLPFGTGALRAALAGRAPHARSGCLASLPLDRRVHAAPRPARPDGRPARPRPAGLGRLAPAQGGRRQDLRRLASGYRLLRHQADRGDRCARALGLRRRRGVPARDPRLPPGRAAAAPRALRNRQPAHPRAADRGAHRRGGGGLAPDGGGGGGLLRQRDLPFLRPQRERRPAYRLPHRIRADARLPACAARIRDAGAGRGSLSPFRRRPAANPGDEPGGAGGMAAQGRGAGSGALSRRQHPTRALASGS